MSKSRKFLVGAALVLLMAGSALAQQAKKTGLGREALPEEVKAWDISIRPDGKGLPVGKGSVKKGEELFLAQCASCHGEFGEAVGRWPVLVGGRGSLKHDSPEKTIGISFSVWPASRIRSRARSTMRTGSPMSSTSTWPLSPMAAACSTSRAASGIVMK